MSRVLENKVADQVAKVASALGYETATEPERTPFRVFGWFRKPEFEPDIFVSHFDKSAIVVTRSSPAMMYEVFLTDQARRRLGTKDTGALICVTDDAFPRVRESSKEYANDLNVRLCPLSEVADALKEILGQPEQAKTTGDNGR